MQELFKINAKAFIGLATEGDLADLQRLYSEYFDAEDGENEPPLSAQGESGDLQTRFQETSKGVDLGIDEESGMDPESLATQLGFVKDRLPVQFNRRRHRMGLTAWSNPSDFEGASSQHENLTPLSLHWHQLAGVHSIIRNTFTAEKDTKKCAGMLICDEVGLGKTTMVISTIAFLNQVVSSESERKGKLPPILGQYFQL
jgi:hypothetical protein